MPSAGTRLVIGAQPLERATPFEIAAAATPTRIGTKGDLLARSVAIERMLPERHEPSVLLGTFQTAERFTPPTRRRLRRARPGRAFVGALGVGLDETPARASAAPRSAPTRHIVDEWNVIALGRRSPAASSPRIGTRA
jgi:hypothetical protein